MKRLLQLVFLLGMLPLCAQQHVPGQFLVQLKSTTNLRYFIDEMATYEGKFTQLKIVKKVIPNQAIWLLEYGNTNIVEEKILDALRKHPSVEIAQFNHKIKQRSAPQAATPNDPNYPIQWHFKNTGQNGGQAGLDVSAEAAWDVATGGYTAAGDTIVVAVLDDGVQLNHPDLQANLWRNASEIPANGIDDDNNGYVDDYLGWNSNTLDDNIHLNSAGGHGTPVAGLIGARGNNNMGVTGVNWVVKMMIIRNDFNTTEANVLAAYGYALNQRQLYNQSGGAQGAYVVATNASWGLDNGQPSQAPLWCAIFDQLGQEGILNVASTTNNNVNVDQVGDLPTTCTSDYLLAVGNLNRFGTYSGGTSSTHIDLAAPGDGCFSTSNGNNYSSFGGTSAASPHVAGAVALAYAAACPQFIQLSKIHPEQAALQMRQFILNGGTPMIVLNGQTASGNRLNLHGALFETQNSCPTDSCFAPGSISSLALTDSSAMLTWTNFFGDSLRLRLRRSNSSNWVDSLFLSPSDTALFSNLQLCSDYEVEFTGYCGGDWGTPLLFFFQTTACCLPPQGLVMAQRSEYTLTPSWQTQQLGQSYVLRWREFGGSSWMTAVASGTSKVITGLQSCTFYEIQVLTNCATTSSSFSSTLVTATAGCGSCTSQQVCTMRSIDSSFDWIESFTIGSFTKNSGNNGGYYLYDSTLIEVVAGTTVPFIIQQGDTYQEYVRIWVDLNQDGDFKDQDELLYEGLLAFVGSIAGNLQIPATAVAGLTRLRVGLQWGGYPVLCSQYQNGEVEDYCLLVSPYTSTKSIEKVSENIQLLPNPNQGKFQLKGLPSGTHRLELYDLSGKKYWENKLVSTENTLSQVVFPQQIPKGIYWLKITNDQQQVTLKVCILP